ncbi:YqjK-like family protein [Aromatoleum diolicum]|uniref:YqjK-like protein n=1 Tax=Aromatoleum diolicum TaxID=75796 RepID=A0ABX1QCV7_9RHOO|nr:YqjK-like family protein [Aromatoleum diolicum]NMG75327.1 hypothetical protein [Aromatoleum diolicum]
MNSKIVELALKKQRLQMRAEQERADMLARLGRIESVLNLVDRARDGIRSLRDNAPLLSAGALLFILLKPRLALRLAQRAWLGWVLYRNLERRFAPLKVMLRRFGA